MIKLGDKVRDRVTGFEGIVVATTTWLNGCARMTVQPDRLDEKGQVLESSTFDDSQLEVVKARAVETGRRDTGGPRPEPSRQPDVTR